MENLPFEVKPTPCRIPFQTRVLVLLHSVFLILADAFIDRRPMYCSHCYQKLISCSESEMKKSHDELRFYPGFRCPDGHEIIRVSPGGSSEGGNYYYRVSLVHL